MNIENITIGQIIAIIVAVQVLGQGVSWFLTPYRKRQEKDKTIADRIKEAEEHLDNDNKRLNTLENDTKQILLSVYALLEHSIDGNNTTDLKKRQKEMNEYIIGR